MSFDLSTRTELSELAETLKAADQAAIAVGAPWFVVGATARDLVLGFCYEMSFSRATADIDIAVVVSSWSSFDLLAADLTDASGFVADPQMAQRFRRGASTIDVVPFGPIATGGLIKWPPGHFFEMSVLGFHEAWKSAVEVVLPGNMVVRVASPAGLLLLKLVAWQDRHLDRPHHDAADIAAVLGTYCSGRGLDHLFADGIPYLEQFSFDVDVAAAALVGFQAGLVAEQATAARVVATLERETDADGRLDLAMDISIQKIERSVHLLQALVIGFHDGLKRRRETAR